MKSLFLSLLLITSCFFSYGQWELNFEDTIALQKLTIDLVSNPNNSWQIGYPQKTILDTPYSAPNVIITDSINPYPTNDTSVFFYTRTAIGGFTTTTFLNHQASIEGYYYVNTDSLNDYGLIEFSPNNGQNWYDIVKDTIRFPNSAWNTPRPTLTGNSSGWQYFRVDLTDLFNISMGDTVHYRFTFISDSTFDGLDGLMFDDLYFDDFVESTNDISSIAFATKAFPNPCMVYTNIQFENKQSIAYELVLHDNMGNIVMHQKNIRSNKVKVNTQRLTPGIYYYKLTNPKNGRIGRGQFTVNN